MRAFRVDLQGAPAMLIESTCALSAIAQALSGLPLSGGMTGRIDGESAAMCAEWTDEGGVRRFAWASASPAEAPRL